MSMSRMRWNVVSASTLAFALLCMALFFGIVGMVYYDSVVSFEDETTRLTSRIESSVPPNKNILEAAHIVAPMLSNHALLVTFIDDQHRVTLRFQKNDKPQTMPMMYQKDRADRSAEPAAEGLIARLLTGCATIFGLHIERGRIGEIDFYVTDNARIFTQAYERYIPYLFCACIVVVLSAIVFSSWLNRRMLRPLTDVTAALHRLSSGDLRLQPVYEAERSPLNALSIAFNGAVAQVRRAFDLRDESDLAIRQFIADAGHQLRTPLTVIRGFLSILEQQNGDVTQEHAFLKTMHQQVNIMSNLIDNLILLDKWDRPSLASEQMPLEIHQFVEDAVGAFAVAYPDRDIRFARKDSDELLILANPYELHHVLSNILDNAVKYAHDPISVTSDKDQNHVRVIISDQGPGMSEQLAARVFDRFMRGDRRDVEGSGLGLSIAKRAVERAGGEIHVVSGVQSGTEITLLLPLASAKA